MIDVRAMVAVEIGDGERARIPARHVVGARAEASRAVAAQERDARGRGVGRRQVEVAVAVNVPEGQGDRPGGRGVVRRRAEGAVAGSQQHAGDAGLAPRREQIEVPVAAHVGEGDLRRHLAQVDVLAEHERAVPGPERLLARPGVVRSDDVEVSVFVDVTERQVLSAADVGRQRGEASQAVAQQDAEGGTALSRGEVGVAVAVQVAGRDGIRGVPDLVVHGRQEEDGVGGGRRDGEADRGGQRHSDGCDDRNQPHVPLLLTTRRLPAPDTVH